MHDVIAWCFHSPRRLLAVAVTVIVVVIAAGAAVQGILAERRSGPQGSTSGVAAPADAAPALDAAVEFTRRWASVPSGQDAVQWRAGLSTLVTRELAAGLELTDPAALPGGAPDGTPVVRFVSVSSALVEVPLSTGQGVLVTVVLVNGRWLASDVQPLAGNAGDEPAVSASASAGG